MVGDTELHRGGTEFFVELDWGLDVKPVCRWGGNLGIVCEGEGT